MKKFILLTTVCAGLLFAGNATAQALRIEVEEGRIKGNYNCKPIPDSLPDFPDDIEYEDLMRLLGRFLRYNSFTEVIALFTPDGAPINSDSELWQFKLGINAKIVAKIVPNPLASPTPASEAPVCPSMSSILRVTVEDPERFVERWSGYGSQIPFSSDKNYEQLKRELQSLLRHNPSTEHIVLFTLDGNPINSDSELKKLGINAEIVAKIVPNPPAAAAHKQPYPQFKMQLTGTRTKDLE